tara:strand:+ start:215 stop:415 length:201 start_codon:yes stop_codon:yes gene_type:complete
MDWSTKKFYYKITRIDKKGEIIGFVYKKLGELEEFIKKSDLQVKSLKRTGPDNFTVEVTANEEWQI